MRKIPKLEPCPNCKTDEHLHILKYDRIWNHVECIKCDYIGPGEGRWKDAAKKHNESVSQPTTETQGVLNE